MYIQWIISYQEIISCGASCLVFSMEFPIEMMMMMIFTRKLSTANLQVMMMII